jgi:hypothetical protein
MWEIEDSPPEQVTWGDLEELSRKTPQRSLHCWERLKQAAREELRSGHRAGGVLEGDDPHPWRRARFLAIREELADGWQPRNGIERQLIDQMAQAQEALFFWQDMLALRASVEVYEAATLAGPMVDRFSKMFLRTLRALQNLRKASPAVLVQNVGEVNVGRQPGERNGEAQPRRRPRQARGTQGACTCRADRRSLVGEAALPTLELAPSYLG